MIRNVLVGAALAVVLAGCGTAVPPEAPAQPTLLAPADAYYAYVQAERVPVERETSLQIGYAICELIRNRGAYFGIQETAILAQQNGVTVQQTTAVTKAALIYLCPDQVPAVEALVGGPL